LGLLQTEPSPDWKGGVAVAEGNGGESGTLESGIYQEAGRTRSAGHSKRWGAIRNIKIPLKKSV